jgi:hypothetical protein
VRSNLYGNNDTRKGKDQNNRNGKMRMYLRSFFLLRGITSMLERCSDTKSTNAIKAHPLIKKPQKLVHLPLSGGLEGVDQNLYKQGWGTTPQVN